jgi:hypothetical protein
LEQQMISCLYHDDRQTHGHGPRHGHATPSPTILDPGSCVDGRTIAAWTGDWWTWGLQAPKVGNPLTDTTGADANYNNGGPVFFIAGTYGSLTSADRTFEVPAGKPVLLPMINFFDIENLPGVPPSAGIDADHGEAALRASMKALITTFLDNVTSLHAEIDGVTVKNPYFYKEVSGFFSMGKVQSGSLLESIGAPAGAPTDTTISGGYWLMIDGLTPGKHTLTFGGTQAAFTFNGPENVNPTFTTSVVDHIKVV